MISLRFITKSIVALTLVVCSAPAAFAAPTDTPAPAETPTTWAVAPADANGPDGRHWFDLDVDPGTQISEHVAVRNLGTENVTFTLSAADGYLTDKGRFNMLASGDESVGAGTWVAIPDTVTIAPGGMAVVPMDISVPLNATPGDHAAGVAASIRSESAAGTVGVESRVGVRVILHVDGAVSPSVETSDVAIDYTPQLNPFLPGTATVQFTLKNDGNTAIAANPLIQVSGPFEMFRQDVGVEPVVLLPGGAREIQVRVENIWPLGMLFLHLEPTAASTDADNTTVAEVWTNTSTPAIPFMQLALLSAIVLLIVLAVHLRQRGRQKVAALVEAARREGSQQEVTS